MRRAIVSPIVASLCDLHPSGVGAREPCGWSHFWREPKSRSVPTASERSRSCARFVTEGACPQESSQPPILRDLRSPALRSSQGCDNQKKNCAYPCAERRTGPSTRTQICSARPKDLRERWRKSPEKEADDLGGRDRFRDFVGRVGVGRRAERSLYGSSNCCKLVRTFARSVRMTDAQSSHGTSAAPMVVRTKERVTVRRRRSRKGRPSALDAEGWLAGSRSRSLRTVHAGIGRAARDRDRALLHLPAIGAVRRSALRGRGRSEGVSVTGVRLGRSSGSPCTGGWPSVSIRRRTISWKVSSSFSSEGTARIAARRPWCRGHRPRRRARRCGA